MLETRNCLPSPKPVGLGTGLAKNSNLRRVYGVLSTYPVIVVEVVSFDVADVRTGEDKP